MEARGGGPRGEVPEEGIARRGPAVGSRVTPAQHVRTFRMHQSLELRLGVFARREKQHEGQRASRGVAATGRGNPLKAEAQGRYRHETRLEGCGWNKASGG